MPIIEVDGLKGNVIMRGSNKKKASLIFIHGAGGDNTAWYPQSNHFSREYTVSIVELPGHGAARGEGADTIRGYTLWVKGMLSMLKITRAFVIGHSMGGAIAMDLAVEFPMSLKGLVLVATGAKLRVDPRILTGIKEDFPSTVELICQVAFATDATEKLRRAGIAEMMKNSPDVMFNDFIACDRFDIMKKVQEIAIPTLIVCGDQDAFAPVHYSRYLAEQIPGARLEIIHGAGHMVMLERPEEFNDTLEAFFRPASQADA